MIICLKYKNKEDYNNACRVLLLSKAHSQDSIKTGLSVGRRVNVQVFPAAVHVLNLQFSLIFQCETRLQRDISAAFQKWACVKYGHKLSSGASLDRTKHKGFNLNEGRFRLDVIYIFIKVMKHWHRFPVEVVDAPLLEIFRVSLDRVLSNLI